MNLSQIPPTKGSSKALALALCYMDIKDYGPSPCLPLTASHYTIASKPVVFSVGLPPWCSTYSITLRPSVSENKTDSMLVQFLNFIQLGFAFRGYVQGWPWVMWALAWVRLWVTCPWGGGYSFFEFGYRFGNYNPHLSQILHKKDQFSYR